MGHCYKQPTDNFTAPYILHSISSIYIGTPLFVIGLISNTICMVLWQRLMRRARNRNITCGIYLITIAIIDTGMILSFFLCDILTYLYPRITEFHSYNVFFAYIGFPSFQFFTFLSFWLIAGVDTCRLTMVLFPIKLRQSATRITNTAIILIILFVFCVNIPNFVAYKASHTADGTPCRWITSRLQTESFSDYIFWFQCVFLTVFPWTIIVLVNAIMLIYKAILPDYTPKIKKRAVEMGNLLFAVSIWFVSTIFWQCVAQCFFLKTPRNQGNWASVDSSFAFAKQGMVLNSSTKLFLFLATSRTFRKAFFHLFMNPKTAYAHITRRSSMVPQKPRKGSQQKRPHRTFRRSINAIMNAPSDNMNKYFDFDTSSPEESIRKMFMAQDVTPMKIEIEIK